MKLEKGELVCDRCEGKGHSIIDEFGFKGLCLKCNGHGKVDWIENLIGVSENEIPTYTIEFIFDPITIDRMKQLHEMIYRHDNEKRLEKLNSKLNDLLIDEMNYWKGQKNNE